MWLLPVCTTDVLKCIIKNDCARDMFRGTNHGATKSRDWRNLISYKRQPVILL